MPDSPSQDDAAQAVHANHSSAEVLREQQRLSQIARRQRKWSWWWWIHQLGSLKLAVFLLVTISIAVAFATILESRFDTAVARYYIYRHIWFKFWLVLLCINLFAAALTRWPWRKRHTGFVVTHGGIILLLIGSMIGGAWGFEAFVRLQKGEPPKRLLFKDRMVIQMQPAAGGGAIYSTPIELEVRPPTESAPDVFEIPHTELKLYVDKYSQSLGREARLVASTVPTAPAGMRLTLSSNSVGQQVPVTLLLDPAQSRFDFFGMAELGFVPQLPPIAAEDQGATPLATPAQEIHMLIAAAPDTPLQSTSAARTSGIRLVLQAGADHDDMRVLATLPGEDEPRDQNQFKLVQSIGQSLAIEGLEGITLQIRQYWPDFTMKDGEPGTLSNDPRNPAVLVELQLPAGFIPQGDNAIQLQQKQMEAAGQAGTPILLLAPAAVAQGDGTPNGSERESEVRVPFYLARGAVEVARGELEIGAPVGLGWNDWTVTLEEYLPGAQIVQEIVEASNDATLAPGEGTRAVLSTNDPAQAATRGSQGESGIRAWLERPDGTKGPKTWLLGGRSKGLSLGDEFVLMALSRQPVPIPFGIELVRFDVPRDPGTDTPSNFIATLKFTNPETGESRIDRAFMNYPAMYPGEWWRSVVGWNYKFSQAGWNKDNLNESTLQVLYDPGWLLKWIGSLLICIGIAIMFYWKPGSGPKVKVQA